MTISIPSLLTHDDDANINSARTEQTHSMLAVGTTAEKEPVRIPQDFNYEDTARLKIQSTLYFGDLEIIVSHYTEKHADVAATTNMLSDSIAMYAYGAMPVEVTLNGFCVESRTYDDVSNLFAHYKSSWRNRLDANMKTPAKLMFRGSSMNFAITSINVSHTTDLSGYAEVAISGIGWSCSPGFTASQLSRAYTIREPRIDTGPLLGEKAKTPEPETVLQEEPKQEDPQEPEPSAETGLDAEVEKDTAPAGESELGVEGKEADPTPVIEPTVVSQEPKPGWEGRTNWF